MKQSHSNDLKHNRPSLCSACLNPSKGFLVHTQGRYYGSCSMECMDIIKERIKDNGGGKLPNVSMLSEVGLDYAVSNTGDKFMKLAKEEKTPNMLKWSRTNRLQLFGKAIQEYMNHQSALAKVGLSNKRADDRHNKIPK